MEMPQHPGDMLQSDAKMSSCSASPSWTRRVLKTRGPERPQWLYKYCCWITPSPLGMITKTREEK